MPLRTGRVAPAPAAALLVALLCGSAAAGPDAETPAAERAEAAAARAETAATRAEAAAERVERAARRLTRVAEALEARLGAASPAAAAPRP